MWSSPPLVEIYRDTPHFSFCTTVKLTAVESGRRTREREENQRHVRLSIAIVWALWPAHDPLIHIRSFITGQMADAGADPIRMKDLLRDLARCLKWRISVVS